MLWNSWCIPKDLNRIGKLPEHKSCKILTLSQCNISRINKRRINSETQKIVYYNCPRMHIYWFKLFASPSSICMLSVIVIEQVVCEKCPTIYEWLHRSDKKKLCTSLRVLAKAQCLPGSTHTALYKAIPR